MTFLIDLSLKATLALSIAFLVSLALCRASASARYVMWTCALAALLLLPLISLSNLRWNFAPRAAAIQADAVSTSVIVHAARPAQQPELPSASWLEIIWLAGSAALLARVLAGHWRVRSLFGNAEEIRDPEWLALTAEIASTIGLRRRIALKRSYSTDVPLSYGLFRATVLLPADAAQWSQERLRIVLMHEMIHTRRSDSLWACLAQLAVAAYWFHPLAWLAAAQFRKERERSCDDAVVTSGTARTVYAAHLVDVARAISLPEPALGMAEAFDLEGRVHALLDQQRKRNAVGRKMCITMFAAALVLTVPLASIHAQTGDKASLSGSVSDPSGAVVPAASISLKNTNGPNEEVAHAGGAGQYSLQGIPPGEYLIKVTVPGFAVYQKVVTLEAGKPATMNVNLAIGEIKETVEIVGKRPQSATPSAASPRRIRVGGNIQPIKLISKVNPGYPADAQAEGVEGTVLLRAVVSKDGSLLNLTSISNGVDPRLVSAAKAAVPLWRYQPALLNAEPVEVITTIAVTFRLN